MAWSRGGHIFRRLTEFLRQPASTGMNYRLVEPGLVSAQVPVSEIPKHIELPTYASGPGDDVLTGLSNPEIKSEDTIARMRDACQLAKEVLLATEKMIGEGVTTDEIDRFVFDTCMKLGAYPSTLNYRGFPKSVCTSVNNCACHGIPDDQKLVDGDIINVDVTVFFKGVHGDCSKTYAVGAVDEAGRRLIEVALKCLETGLQTCGPGVLFQNIGRDISRCAKSHGFTILPTFAGHGIGEYFHGPPDIYHVANSYPGVMLPGMTFTIEPAVGEGGKQVVVLEDGWTVVTEDGSRSAQFEHTILVTANGIEILTA